MNQIKKSRRDDRIIEGETGEDPGSGWAGKIYGNRLTNHKLMKIDKELLEAFEKGLNFFDVGRSVVPGRVLGYGEISSIFSIEGMPDIAFKRMPPFGSREEAWRYAFNYQTYCDYLKACGLALPESETVIIPRSEEKAVLFIAQQLLPSARFGHKLIHHLDGEDTGMFIKEVVESIEKVWQYNRRHEGEVELAIDGQISNWVWMEKGTDRQLYYVDTSTPLFKLGGHEQLDPELFLKSAPSFLRGIIRALFLQEVMDHYYDAYGVYRDLAANLYKEQRPDLIPYVLKICNRFLPDGRKVTERAVKKYYQSDSLTWSVFLASRRLDRWLRTKILREKYEYLLPGKIKR